MAVKKINVVIEASYAFEEIDFLLLIVFFENGAAFLKALLDLAKDTAAAVKKAQSEAPEPPTEDKGKAALTELFNSVKNRSTPIIVERMVNEIDEIVKIVRFPGWKDTPQGRNDVEKALRSVFVRKKMFDNELFEKAYDYVEQYY